MALGAVCFLLTVAVGGGAAATLTLAATFTASGLMFGALAAVTAQLGSDARTSSSLAIAALGILFALRGYLDSSGAAEWTVWLTPLGWLERAVAGVPSGAAELVRVEAVRAPDAGEERCRGGGKDVVAELLQWDVLLGTPVELGEALVGRHGHAGEFPDRGGRLERAPHGAAHDLRGELVAVPDDPLRERRSLSATALGQRGIGGHVPARRPHRLGVAHDEQLHGGLLDRDH